MAYSVEGESVTLYLDCVRLDTLELLRGHNSHVSTEGVTVFGTRLLDEDVFEVCAYVYVFYVRRHRGQRMEVILSSLFGGNSRKL